MKSRCDEVRFADEVENLRFRLELNPLIAEATSSELCEDFICTADLFHRQVDLIAFAVQMPHSHSIVPTGLGVKS